MGIHRLILPPGLSPEPMGQTRTGTPVLKVHPESVTAVAALSHLAQTEGWHLVQLPRRFDRCEPPPLDAPVVAVCCDRMPNRLRIEPAARYALVGAGVSHQDLTRALEPTGLRHHQSLLSPDRELVFDALCGGPGTRANRYGDLAAAVTGLELVRPGGQTVRIGALSLGDQGFSRTPLPDLFSLVLGTRGHAGIVTQVALRLEAETTDATGHAVQPGATAPTLTRYARMAMAESVLAAIAWRTPDGTVGLWAEAREPLPSEWIPTPAPPTLDPNPILAAVAPSALIPAWQAAEAVLSKEMDAPAMAAIAYQGGTGHYLVLPRPAAAATWAELGERVTAAGAYRLPGPGLTPPVEWTGPISRRVLGPILGSGRAHG